MTTETLMVLSDEEARLVLRTRQDKAARALRLEQQKACTHAWRFVARGYCDSLYECTKCGSTKEE